jgi:hypothetical protein
MKSPYQGLPPERFWKAGVAGRTAADVTGIYRKKICIDPDTKIATAGSCFAQHVTRRLKQVGYSVLDVEPPPPGLTTAVAQQYGYRLFSARYGNIYTVRQMRQLVQEALVESHARRFVWTKGAKFFDALRPSVEPHGLDRSEEIELHRDDHIRRVKRMLTDFDVLVFTFGLTEAWVDKTTGQVFPVAPGTIAGDFDDESVGFRNFTYNEIYQDFVHLRNDIKAVNPDAAFLITVSPVPLTATASQAHVLSATVRSKSVLRAVAGQLYDDFEDVDYFPAYELVSTPFLGENVFHDNMRTVTANAVDVVMGHFFAAHGCRAQAADRSRTAAKPNSEDAVCEDMLLEAFAP